MDFHSDISSDVSDVDAQAIVNSLKNMDDLDAELFGNKKKNQTTSKNQPKSTATKDVERSSRRVSFKSPTFESDDIDMDDPLAGILSDEDRMQSENKSSFRSSVKPVLKPATRTARKSSEGDDSDGLFGDDNDDLLKTLGLDDDTPKTQTSKESNKVPFNDILQEKAAPHPSTAKRPSSKYHFDKDGNLVTEKVPEEISFGTYMPSSASTSQRPLRNMRTSMPRKEDNFLDFLDDDVTANTKLTPTKNNQVPKAQSDFSSTRRSRNVDFLQLGDEVDLDALIEEKESSAVGKSTPSVFSPIETPEAKKPDQPLPVQNVASPALPNKSRLSTPSPITQPSFSPQPVQRKTISAISSEEQPAHNVEGKTPSPIIVPSPTNNAPITSGFLFDRKPPINTNQSVTSNVRTSVQAPALSNAQHLTQETFRDLRSGFQTDLEITKQAYDNRVEALHSAVTDIRARAEREVEAIKESYNMRMEGVRRQIRDQMQEVSEKDMLEQEEIKRLRTLHMTALEDTRLDYEDRIKRMKEAHHKDIETLKSSTVYVRNLDEMMRRVDETAQQVNRLSSRHEAAFNNFDQKWNGVVAENKRILSGFQTQIEEIRNSSFEMQNNLQQTVSRLEGNMTEISRALREQQYHLQLERNRLESCQTSLENEKRQLYQQVAAQSAEAMKAHKEAIELRQNHERDIREDSDRFRQREDQLQRTQRVLEEARAAEAKHATERERERRNMEEELSRERAAMAEKVERLAALEARLAVEKEELDRRQTALTISEKRVDKKTDDLALREEELRLTEERASRKLADSAAALEEAKRVEKGQESRLSDIHDNANALARQRLLLAEERKQMIEDRVKYRPSEGDPGIVPVIDASPRFSSSRLPRRDISFSPNNANSSNAAMWSFTAQQDRDFLQDEQVFLEALKYSPQRQSHGM